MIDKICIFFKNVYFETYLWFLALRQAIVFFFTIDIHSTIENVKTGEERVYWFSQTLFALFIFIVGIVIGIIFY